MGTAVDAGGLREQARGAHGEVAVVGGHAPDVDGALRRHAQGDVIAGVAVISSYSDTA